jgi:L-ascorbate metabolism protein UlaG (beta-lactamase superfamily)
VINMEVTHLGHSCLVVDTPHTRILIDPGTLAASWETVTDIDAVLITHAHPDHVDWERLPALLADNPGAALYFEPELAASEDARNWTAKPLPAGASASVGDVTVEAVGGEHAVIHRDVPRIGNVGFVLRQKNGPTLFHPGDSYETAPEGVDVLAVPLNAPWGAVKEAIDFTRAVAPRIAIPIHDGLLADAGRATYLRLLRAQGGQDGAELDILDLAGAGSTSVDG